MSPAPTDPIPVSRRVVLVNAVAGVVAQILHAALLIWLQPYLLARIPIEEYALYPVVMAPLLLVPLLTGTLADATGRFAVERLARGDRGGVTAVASTLLPITVALGAGCAVLVIATVVWIEPLLRIDPALVPDARWMFAALGVIATARIATAPLTVGPYVRQHFVAQAGLQLSTQVLRVLLVLGGVVLVRPAVLTLVLSSVAAELIGLIASLVVSRRLLPELRMVRAAVDRGQRGRLLAFGGWTMTREVAMALRRGTPPLLLHRVASSVQVSCFYLGSLVLQQIQALTVAAIRPLLPPLVAMHSRGQHERLRDVYLRGSRYGMWAAVLIVPPFVVYRDELVALYLGPGLSDAGRVMALMVLHLPLRYANLMLPAIAPATGRVKELAYVATFQHALVIATMAFFVIVLRRGATGAAEGSLLASAVAQPLHWRLGRRIAGVEAGEWARAALAPAALPCAAGIATWCAARAWIPADDWAALIAGIALGGVATLGCLLAFALDRRERAAVRGAVRGAFAGRGAATGDDGRREREPGNDS